MYIWLFSELKVKGVGKLALVFIFKHKAFHIDIFDTAVLL